MNHIIKEGGRDADFLSNPLANWPCGREVGWIFDLEDKIARQFQCSPRPAIALSRVPPFGLLDRDRSSASIGHRPLRRFLDTHQGRNLELIQCGHAHEDRGALCLGNSWIVNVAGGFAVLDDADDTWRVAKVGPLAKGIDPLSLPIPEVL